MKYIDFKSINEKVLYEKLFNGLEVYILRKKDFTTSEARLFVDFGSKDVEFIPKGEKEFKKMPSGIAHYLEHKMFEQKDGTNAFDFYEKTGASVNAFTNYTTTCYYFSCTSNFKKNLNYLLDFVQSPYFTDKNVEKERGIIIEEAKMYMDEPMRIMINKSNECLFNEIPYYYPIEGTIDDIKKITKEDLYECYNTFYHPSNMKLIIVSNLEEEKVLETVKNNQNKKVFDKPTKIIRKEYKENASPKKEYLEEKININEKRVLLATKFSLSDFDYEKNEVFDSIVILLSFLIGGLSEFNQELKKNEITKSEINFSCELIKNNGNDLLVVFINATVNDENKFLELLNKRLKDKNVSKEEFLKLKKLILSSIFYNLNTVPGTMEFLYGEAIFYGEINNKNIEIDKNLSYEKFQKIINKLTFEKKLIVILKPKNN